MWVVVSIDPLCWVGTQAAHRPLAGVQWPIWRVVWSRSSLYACNGEGYNDRACGHHRRPVSLPHGYARSSRLDTCVGIQSAAPATDTRRRFRYRTCDERFQDRCHGSRSGRTPVLPRRPAWNLSAYGRLGRSRQHAMARDRFDGSGGYG